MDQVLYTTATWILALLWLVVIVAVLYVTVRLVQKIFKRSNP